MKVSSRESDSEAAEAKQAYARHAPCLAAARASVVAMALNIVTKKTLRAVRFPVKGLFSDSAFS